MRGTLRSLCACLMFAALAILAVPARAQDPYAEFRTPEFRRLSWNVTGQGQLSTFFRGAPFGQERNRFSFARVLSPLILLAESETQSTTLFLQPSASWNHWRFGRDQSSFFIVPGQSTAAQENRWDDQSLGVFADHDQYLGGTNRFVGASVSAGGVFSQRIRDTDQEFLSGPDRALLSDHQADRLYQFTSEVGIRTGLGRLRNVTGVYLAQLIEQRLRGTGRLERELSHESRMRLAELFYLSFAFDSAHERAEKHFWGEVERILREDGALKDGTLDSYSTLRVLEPAMNQFTWNRQRGLAVAAISSVFLSRGHTDHDSRTEQVFTNNGIVTSASRFESSDRVRIHESDVLSGVRAEYGAPLAASWQLDASTSARYGGGVARIWQLQAHTSLVWLIADRWFALGGAFYRLDSRRVGGDRIEPDWSVQSVTRLGYWLEDSWALDASFIRTQQASHRLSSVMITPSHERFGSLQVALTYRPAGGFDAPGLGISQHLTPGVH